MMSPYREVAKQALMSWNGLEEKEAQQQAETLSIEQLESQVWASGSIDQGIDMIASLFSLTKEEREKFKAIVYGKEVSKEDETFLQEIGQKTKLYRDCPELLALQGLHEIHDKWVEDNAKKFNKEGREGKKYQHLPLELIGFKEAKADMLFLKPLLDSIGLNVEEEKLKKAYDNEVRSFLNENGLMIGDEISSKKLADKIMQGNAFYAPLTETNTAKTQDEAQMIAEQSKEKTKLNENIFV